MRWFDKRISLDLDSTSREFTRKNRFGTYLLFNRDPVKDLWFPDVFIDKAKQLRVPVYKIPPVYLRIYESSLLMYSARVNYDLSCPMTFSDYPVDEQICDITFESWGHPIEILKFDWDINDTVVNPAINLNQHSFQVALLSAAGKNFSTGNEKLLCGLRG